MPTTRLRDIVQATSLGLALSQAPVLGVPAARADTALTTLYTFPADGKSANGYSHGATPWGDVMQAADGNFYGTATYGGSSICNNGFVVGCGVVFKLTPGGIQTVLHSFTFNSKTNAAAGGGWPTAGLVQGPDGSFYGTTSAFGNNTAMCNATGGCGTVFKISPTGKFKLLYSFAGATGDCKLTDGGQPRAKLLLARNGVFYGTTYAGACGQYGTVFRITSAGAYQQVHAFSGTDGDAPTAGLIQGKDGAFYGTTQFGGANGAGEVFKITSSGALTVLYSFVSGSTNGSQPIGGLVQASDGNLYGTANSDGAGGAGTLFRISTKGHFTKLYDFSQSAPYTGVLPRASLVQASDGNLYGTTWRGGANNDGTIFQATLAGAVTGGASFDYGVSGSGPLADVLQAADGTLVSAAYQGGANGSLGGTVVQLSLGLRAPSPVIARFTPVSGTPGTSVTITGAGYVGASTVAFNGVSASFKIDSPTSIKAVVPAGATTGPISVTNAGGTTKSSKVFTIP